MPPLTTRLHLEMLKRAQDSGQAAQDGLYGLHWGDPEDPQNVALQSVLDLDVIRDYLDNLRSVIHPRSQVVIQYADKDKPQARRNRGFSENDPRRMRAAVEDAGYRILEEDTTSLDHSAIMRFRMS